MLSVHCSHAVGEVPPLLKAQGDFLPISGLWYGQKFIHEAVPNGLGHIWHNVCHSGDAHPVTGGNGGVGITSCQVSEIMISVLSIKSNSKASSNANLKCRFHIYPIISKIK